ncbi:MAG: hypothetical protein ACSHWU_11730 [Marinicella sp.]
MKKLLIIICTMVTSTGFTMDANQLKEAALQACNTQLESVPEEMREKSKKACECNVKNTDYAAVLDAQKTGDTDKIQADALKVATECAKEAL